MKISHTIFPITIPHTHKTIPNISTKLIYLYNKMQQTSNNNNNQIYNPKLFRNHILSLTDGRCINLIYDRIITQHETENRTVFNSRAKL